MDKNNHSVNHVKKNTSEIKVIENEKYQLIIQLIGWIILSFCIYLWIYNVFVIEVYKRVLHTTYITIILVSFTCINKFESSFFNSATLISTFMFVIVTILFIPLAQDFTSLMSGVILHVLIVIFQVYLFINKKVPTSKKYLLWSFLFYLIFINGYDSYARIHAAIHVENEVPELLTAVNIFYLLALSTLIVYLWKKKFGILLP